MKKSRIRIQAAFLGFILLPATAGIIAVRASATCERFVKTYVTKPVRNLVSQQTAEAWAKWHIGHPNWKPNPNAHRPKYLMTREESVKKVEFACAVPLIPADAELRFNTADLEPPPAPVNLHMMDTTQIDFPELTPPEVAENTPLVPILPIIPPNYTLLGGGSIPEPATLGLVGTGFGFLCLLFSAKGRRFLRQR